MFSFQKEVRTPALRSSEHTVTDLRPFTSYEVNVFSENGFGRSLPTDSVKARTYESVPSGSPRNIVVTAEGSKAAIIKWNPVAELSTNGDVIGYKLRVVPERESLMADETKVIDIPGQSTLMAKVSDLRPFTSYHVYMSAYTIVGNGPENSTPISFETMEDVPAPPESFQCSYISEQEVRMKWLPPGSPNGKITVSFEQQLFSDQNRKNIFSNFAPENKKRTSSKKVCFKFLTTKDVRFSIFENKKIGKFLFSIFQKLALYVVIILLLIRNFFCFFFKSI